MEVDDRQLPEVVAGPQSGDLLAPTLDRQLPVYHHPELLARLALTLVRHGVVGGGTDLPTWTYAIAAAVLASSWRLLAVWRGWHAPRPPGAARRP